MEQQIAVVQALVQTGSVVTPYLRAGRGPGVILLRRWWSREGTDPLFRLLAGRFRVTAPRPVLRSQRVSGPEEPRPLSYREWLCGVMDGLGMDRPAVVADARLDAELIRFLAGDAGRVGRVALLTGAPSGGIRSTADRGSPWAHGDRDASMGDSVPLIRLPASPEGLPEPSVKARLLAFLSAA